MSTGERESPDARLFTRMRRGSPHTLDATAALAGTQGEGSGRRAAAAGAAGKTEKTGSRGEGRADADGQFLASSPSLFPCTLLTSLSPSLPRSLACVLTSRPSLPHSPLPRERTRERERERTERGKSDYAKTVGAGIISSVYARIVKQRVSSHVSADGE